MVRVALLGTACNEDRSGMVVPVFRFLKRELIPAYETERPIFINSYPNVSVDLIISPLFKLFWAVLLHFSDSELWPDDSVVVGQPRFLNKMSHFVEACL